MATFAVSDFVITWSGLLNTQQNDLIPSASKSLTSTINRLVIEMLEAPTGQSARFEFFKDGASIGIVEVLAGAIKGETVVTEIFASGQKLTMNIIQSGNIFPGRTATGYGRAA